MCQGIRVGIFLYNDNLIASVISDCNSSFKGFFFFSCGIGTIASKDNLLIGIYHAGKKLAVGFRAAFLYRRVLILSEIPIFVYVVGAVCNLIDFFKQGSTVAFRDIDAAFFRLPASAFSEEGCSCCCDCKCCCGSLFCAHAFRGRILFSHFGCRLFFGNEIITAPVVYFGRLFFVCAFFSILPFSVLSCHVISSA